jgi:hypothetical protein
MSHRPSVDRPSLVNRFSGRVVLVVLALMAAYVGLWALFGPGSFYANFPGGSRHWVAVDRPFNEHLVRDVGALYCGLCVLTVAAVVGFERAAVRTAGLVWLVFGVPHLAYHLAHLGVYGGLDRVLNVVALGGTLLLAALLVLPGRDAGSARAVSSAPVDQAGRGDGR